MKGLYEDDRAIGTPKRVSESGTARATPREVAVFRGFGLQCIQGAPSEILGNSTLILAATSSGLFRFRKFRNEVFGGGGVTCFSLPCLVLGAMTVSLLLHFFFFSFFQPTGCEFVAH